MKVVYGGVFARPDNRNIEARCKSSLEVDTSARTFGFAGEVSDYKSGAPNCSDDFVVYFREMVMFLVDADRIISAVVHGLVQSVFIWLVGFLTEPHSNERLGRVNCRSLKLVVSQPVLWAERKECFMCHAKQVHIAHHF